MNRYPNDIVNTIVKDTETQIFTRPPTWIAWKYGGNLPH
ncbi:hypothetical protein BB65665_01454 [Bacillus sp. 916]|nr:hypothetical protein BB65665_01454 [Bacillus sp. 916]